MGCFDRGKQSQLTPQNGFGTAGADSLLRWVFGFAFLDFLLELIALPSSLETKSSDS